MTDSSEWGENPAVFWTREKVFILVGPVSIPLPPVFFLEGEKLQTNEFVHYLVLLTYFVLENQVFFSVQIQAHCVVLYCLIIYP